MAHFPKKTLEDLELHVVLDQVSQRCSTPMGKQLALQITPMEESDRLFNLLAETNEYLSSLMSDTRIPGNDFEAIHKELQLLGIENTTIGIDGFQKIKSLNDTVGVHQKFLTKFSEYYPHLAQKIGQIHHVPEISTHIGAIVDRFGKVKDHASAKLNAIRSEIRETSGKIDQSFLVALQRAHTAHYLDDIRESVVENRRVLAVKAMYRKRVKGTVMGSSKTGSIIFMEPETTAQLNRAMVALQVDEKEEVQRLLKALTDQIRPYAPQLAYYQTYMAEMDLTAAKAKYALEMDALLPKINQERKMFLRDAYHPLLYMANKRKRLKTFPQTVDMHRENRIMVISGPNAGGKSITLKTIGLLQLMLQSGLLVPVHERSSMCLFKSVLSDIGDNQSIENHLSTYSYRLKNMNRFLRRCNASTLFLIDEFGTGSDPELGGALAEVFLEVFYEREAFGAITTHYANLKALANELPHATNANMLFNRTTLEPAYQLVMGEAGSSFTFEVAQKNGIPYSLINKAKKKIERGKVRFDATIAKLQKERTKMAQTGSKLREEEAKVREEASRMEKINQKIKSKLEDYQELYDHNQRMVHLGNKINKVAEQYFLDKKKRPLISELLRIVETENSKRKKTTFQEAKKKRTKQNKVQEDMGKKVVEIRQRKKEEAQQKKKEVRNTPKPPLKEGDRVRLPDGKAIGTINSIEKKVATVHYGMFTTKVNVEKLVLVTAKKIS